MPLLVALLAASGAAGCAADGAADPVPPEVTLGTGDVSFESLQSGDDIYIVQGPQGGFHFFGSVLVRGIDPGDPDNLDAPDNPTTDFQVWSGGARVDVMAAHYVQGLEPGPDANTYEMIGRLVILDIQADDELAGAQVRFLVSVTDTAGNSASCELMLTAVRHPNNP